MVNFTAVQTHSDDEHFAAKCHFRQLKGRKKPFHLCTYFLIICPTGPMKREKNILQNHNSQFNSFWARHVLTLYVFQIKLIMSRPKRQFWEGKIDRELSVACWKASASAVKENLKQNDNEREKLFRCPGGLVINWQCHHVEKTKKLVTPKTSDKRLIH